MHKLVSFFIRHYKSQLEPRVKEYLDSKKLTLDQWLESVKNNHHGDILCIYLLHMVTGTHTCVHLKGELTWSTLKVVPLIHEELIERCLVHLVYLGFGIFLRLKCRPPIEVNVFLAPLVIGHVTSEQLAVMQQLVAATIKQEPITSTNTGTTHTRRP